MEIEYEVKSGRNIGGEETTDELICNKDMIYPVCQNIIFVCSWG